MTATEQQAPPPELGDLSGGPEAGFYTIGLGDVLDLAGSSGTLEGVDATIDDTLAAQAHILDPEKYSTLEDLLGLIKEAVDSGEIMPADVGGLMNFLESRFGVTVLTAATVSTGALAYYVYTYALSKGYKPTAAPPKGPTYHLTTPTAGQRVTTTSAKAITPQSVTAPGLTGAEAAAVSAALGVTFADAMKVHAYSLDQMLPGLEPGQVPEALSNQNFAIKVLEHQVAQLRAEVPPGTHPVLRGQVAATQATISALEAAISALQAQMATEASSALLTDITDLRGHVEGLSEDVSHIDTVTVPALTAGLVTVTGTVTALSTTVDDKVVPELAQVAKTAEANAAKLALTTDECLSDLCESESQVTRPIQEGGATPSLLKGLGGLLGGAFTLLSLASLAETALAIIDLPVAMKAIVQDTETLAGWAGTSANWVASDLTWSAPLGN